MEDLTLRLFPARGTASALYRFSTLVHKAGELGLDSELERFSRLRFCLEWPFGGIRTTRSLAGCRTNLFGRKSIAVLDFRNVTGSPDVEWLSTALGEMLAADLTASGRFQAVPGAEVSRALSEISFKANTPPAPAQIERIAKRVGADRVVIGRYSVSRDQFRVDAELLSGRSDEVIAAVSETGTQDDLFQVVSRVGRELAEKLQDRELSETEVARLKASFPEDSRARQDYYQGLARLRAGNAVAAAHFLEEAVSRDPGFPLAHSALAEALAILGYETKAIEEAKRASETAAALPRDQVLASEGQYYTVNRDWLRAVKVYGALNSLWPDDFDYLLKLANAEAKQGREKEAYEAINQLRKLSVSPDDPRPDLAEASVADIFADYNRENPRGWHRRSEGTTSERDRAGGPSELKRELGAR